MQFLTYAALGLGTGAINALLACGLVLIYRGSGVINFAQGGFALLGAYALVDLSLLHNQSFTVSLIAALVLTALVGLLVQVVLMRALRTASPLARVIATLGLLTVINQAVQLKFGVTQQTVNTSIPSKPLSLGSVKIPEQNLYLVAIAAAVAIVLWLLTSRTRPGRALSAAAESPRSAAALGWSPSILASVTWAGGAMVAGLAGVLFPATSTGFVSSTQMSALIIAGLATALLAEFRSFGIALVAGLVIGMVQSIATGYINQTGVADATPFIFIVLVLVVRGKGLPVRGTVTDRLPRVGGLGLRAPVVLACGLVGLVVVLWLIPETWYSPVIISASFAIVGLSLVVLVGYAGQLSLAQFALGGVGAYVAGRLAAAHGWGMAPALVAGVLAAMLVGFVVGLPALRTRGVNLAVITFGLGFAIYELVFSNSSYTGGSAQTQIVNPHFLGIPVDPIMHQGNYAALCVAGLTLAGMVVANLRRSRAGRRLLAVRTNERAAAALGVNVFWAKLYAFTISAGIAGLGGVLLGFSYNTILYQQIFTPDISISVLVLTVIGGIGYVSGPTIGSILATGGIAILFFGQNALLESTGPVEYLPLATGIALLLTLVASQNGVVDRLFAGLRLGWTRLPFGKTGGAAGSSPLARPSAPSRATPRTLSASGLVQRFGGFTALDGVEVRVEPGTVLGLLGPNGAGKTTLIDVLTGYLKPTAGTVEYANGTITSWGPHRRSRAGLTRSFQSLELFDDLTVRENLMAASDEHDLKAYLTGLVLPGRSRPSAAVLATVEELGLGDVLDRRPEELSYGRRRLVAIARAVANRPSILLLDEPAAGLEDTQSAEVGHLIRRLADEWGIGVLLIEHDVAMVLGTADRVQVLDFGRTIAEGTPEQIKLDPVVRAAYLGESTDSSTLAG